MPYAPEGDIKNATYVFIGEAPGKREMMIGRPLVGPAGRVFDECLEGSGIPRHRCYLTNLFPFMVTKDHLGKMYDPEGYELWNPRKGFTGNGREHVNRLADELSGAGAHVFCPMGSPALEALCGYRAITKYRGSILPATPANISGHKCVPTVHPANALHGQFTNRYIIRFDFKRVRKESKFPEIRRPEYRFTLNPTFRQCKDFLSSLLDGKNHAVDIEVGNRQCSRICFSSDVRLPTENHPGGGSCISIPYGDGGWTEEQEAELWLLTARVLESDKITKIFQNGIFDMQFLLMVHGIMVQPPFEDTMIAHHIMYPDFSKGLAFMTSIYTDQPYYKDMVRHGDVEKADG